MNKAKLFFSIIVVGIVLEILAAGFFGYKQLVLSKKNVPANRTGEEKVEGAPVEGIDDAFSVPESGETGSTSNKTSTGTSPVTKTSPTTSGNNSTGATSPTNSPTSIPTIPTTPPTVQQPVSPYPNVITSISTTNKIVALTFDDGPGGLPPDSPTNSTQIVCNILKQKGVKATFFYIGARVSSNLTDAKTVDSNCGETANHSWGHYNLSGVTDKTTITSEIKKVDDLFIQIWGKRSLWFRPMGGGYNSTVSTISKEQGHSIVLWNVKSHDYRDSIDISKNYWYPAASIKTDIINNTTPGSIILLHSTYKYTPSALPEIIDGLKAKGYTITTVTELLRSGGTVKGISTTAEGAKGYEFRLFDFLIPSLSFASIGLFLLYKRGFRRIYEARYEKESILNSLACFGRSFGNICRGSYRTCLHI